MPVIFPAPSVTQSGTHRTEFKPLDQIERMLDCIVGNEAQPDIVQVSGGEPTIHPHFFEVLDAAKRRPIRHLMVNTNGIRIAQDEVFSHRLAAYMPRFELYLQFDSLRREPLIQLRGADLRNIRERALERLNKLGISTTLVVTVERGVNDDELGSIVEYALKQPCVRGVTFQPVQQAGRLVNYDGAAHRLTLSEVRRRILDQTSYFKPEDLIPVPCHPDSLAMGYALKLAGKIVPLTGLVSPDVLINGGRNTIIYEQDPAVRASLERSPDLRNQIFKLFSTNHSPSRKPTTYASSSAASRRFSRRKISDTTICSAFSSSSSSTPRPSISARSRKPVSTLPTQTVNASSLSTHTTCSIVMISNTLALAHFAVR